MKIMHTSIADVVVLEPRIFTDNRGYFYESFNRRVFEQATGNAPEFVQDNHSRSKRNVIRGLHFQVGRPQGKLVRVIQGVVFDVAVDLRADSPTFGRWTGVELSAENRKQLWIPPHLAHGFLVLSDHADVVYKTTDYYDPEAERTIRWNDETLGIAWPLTGPPVLSQKDREGLPFAGARFVP